VDKHISEFRPSPFFVLSMDESEAEDALDEKKISNEA
jgi:hypothetical protein